MKKKIFAAAVILVLVGFIVNMHLLVSEMNREKFRGEFRKLNHIAVVSVNEIIKKGEYNNTFGVMQVHDVLYGKLPDEIIMTVPWDCVDIMTDTDEEYLVLLHNSTSPIYEECKYDSEYGIYIVDGDGNLIAVPSYKDILDGKINDIESLKAYIAENPQALKPVIETIPQKYDSLEQLVENSDAVARVKMINQNNGSDKNFHIFDYRIKKILKGKKWDESDAKFISRANKVKNWLTEDGIVFMKYDERGVLVPASQVDSFMDESHPWFDDALEYFGAK